MDEPSEPGQQRATIFGSSSFPAGTISPSPPISWATPAPTQPASMTGGAKTASDFQASNHRRRE